MKESPGRLSPRQSPEIREQPIVGLVQVLGNHPAIDDASREYAYGPARGLPDSKFGTFTAALDDEAKKRGWTVISMKNDWKRVFAFE